MGYKNSSLLCLALFLAVSSSIHAFDITALLGQYPELATFNKYLTETKLADQINSRNAITVLAVNDAALSGLSGKSQDVIKATLSTHVILDFFDQKKLIEAQGSGQQLTTLYQASGLAADQQGFLKVALIGEGGIAFGSAVTGAPIDAELMKTVVSQPSSIAVFQVTKLIVVPGMEAKTPSTPSSNAQAPTVEAKAEAKAPAASATTKAPVATETAKAPAQAAQAPTQSAKAQAQAPAPTESAKAQAPTQSAKAQAKAPAQATPAPTQSAKAPAQTAEAPAQSVEAPAPAKVAPAQTPPPTEEVATPTEAPTTTAEAPATTAEAPTTTAEAPADAVTPGPASDEVKAADATTPSSSTKTQIGLVGVVMAFASLLVSM